MTGLRQRPIVLRIAGETDEKIRFTGFLRITESGRHRLPQKAPSRINKC